MRMQTGTRGGRRTGLVALLAVLVVTVAAFAATSASAKPQAGKYILGVSNTLVGNGWREEMICAVKAQATASGAGQQGRSSPTATAAPPSRSRTSAT